MKRLVDTWTGRGGAKVKLFETTGEGTSFAQLVLSGSIGIWRFRGPPPTRAEMAEELRKTAEGILAIADAVEQSGRLRLVVVQGGQTIDPAGST